MKLIYEKSSPGRKGSDVPVKAAPKAELPKNLLRQKPAEMPEVSECETVRHFTELSRRNFGVDTGFYPLGSCTMKYNPKINEEVSAYAGFKNLHPMMMHLDSKMSQGSLKLIYGLQQALCELTGMGAFTTQPLAGAHGELTGTLIIAAYHRAKGNKKTKVIVPDSAHGTNPASASVGGFTIVPVASGDDGFMNVAKLKEALDSEVAAVMLTCPNTVGMFNPHIAEITKLTHKAGALMYYDGANMNAMMGKCRPGDLGFDVLHLNLHKTFSTPHGGGGPGSGPVGVSRQLAKFLPKPIVAARKNGVCWLDYNRPESIGHIAPFFGNFAVLAKAYAYILQLGGEGLTKATEYAVLNANYVQARLNEYYDIAFDRLCMHECVFSASRQNKTDVHALDLAKGLIDRGFHPPTIYFPLIVKEALMIEPTETESKETLDTFCEVMIELAKIAQSDPASLKAAPVTMPVTRLDEVKCAKDMDIALL